MFIQPVKEVLRGVRFEGSSFDKSSFYATWFVMPLCVPTDHLYGNFGARVRLKNGADRWTFGIHGLIEELSLAIQSQAMPILSGVRSALDFVEFAKSYSENPQTLRAVAFSLARSGRVGQAVSLIDQLLAGIDTRIAWQVEIAQMARCLKLKLLKDSGEAVEQLKVWETETLQNLKLEESYN